MGRTKGATNKNERPILLTLSEEERINVLANIILEIVAEEREKQ